MTPNIEFKISSDIYHLSVTDYSDWQLISNKPSIIDITLPGHRKSITKYFDKNKVNVFNSFTLDVNCFVECDNTQKVELPDGIYKIKVTGSPSIFSKTKYYLKTDEFDLDFDKFFLKHSERKDDDILLKELIRVQFLIRGAEAHTRYESFDIATSQFEQAVKLLETLRNKYV